MVKFDEDLLEELEQDYEETMKKGKKATRGELEEDYEEVKDTAEKIEEGEEPGDLTLLLTKFANDYGFSGPDYHLESFEDFENELDFLYRDMLDTLVFS